jgi:hypothetical protein
VAAGACLPFKMHRVCLCNIVLQAQEGTPALRARSRWCRRSGSENLFYTSHLPTAGHTRARAGGLTAQSRFPVPFQQAALCWQPRCRRSPRTRRGVPCSQLAPVGHGCRFRICWLSFHSDARSARLGRVRRLSRHFCPVKNSPDTAVAGTRPLWLPAIQMISCISKSPAPPLRAGAERQRAGTAICSRASMAIISHLPSELRD